MVADYLINSVIKLVFEKVSDRSISMVKIGCTVKTLYLVLEIVKGLFKYCISTKLSALLKKIF